MDRLTTLVIEADINEVPGVTTAIEEAMRVFAFPEDAILDLQLAVEEAITNAIIHGYHGAVGEVEIIIHATRGVVEVRIEDCAPPFNPLLLPEPDLGSDLDKRQIGGVGVHLIRQVADEVTYRYTGGKNILTLVKRRMA